MLRRRTKHEASILSFSAASLTCGSIVDRPMYLGERVFPQGTARSSPEPPTSFLRDLGSAIVGEIVIPFLHMKLLTKRSSAFSVIQNLPLMPPLIRKELLSWSSFSVFMKYVFKDHARLSTMAQMPIGIFRYTSGRIVQERRSP